MIALRELTVELDTPPSANNLFINLPRRGRAKSEQYRTWIAGALKELTYQRAKPVAWPVAINIFLPETMRGDASNRIKPCEDLLVRAEIIPGDSKKHVRSVSITFHEGSRMKVTVKSLAAVGV